MENTVQVTVGSRLEWNGYVIACPKCESDTGLTLRLRDDPGADPPGPVADVKCNQGHDFEDPLVSPPLVEAMKESGSPPEGWRPYYRAAHPYVPGEIYHPWERAYQNHDLEYGRWEKSHPELCAAAWAGVTAGSLRRSELPHSLSLGYKTRTGPISQGKCPPGTIWEIRVDDTTGETRTVVGPSLPSAVLQQAHKLFSIEEGRHLFRVQEWTNQSSDAEAWPYYVTVSTVNTWPGALLEAPERGWVCSEHSSVYHARKASPGTTAGESGD